MRKKNRPVLADMAPDVIAVILKDLIVDPANQVRKRRDPNTVSRYASAMFEGVQFPPITITLLNEAPVLVDGFHRVEAAKRSNLRSLPARVIEAKPEEMLWIAAEANLQHGLPLNRKDARSVFRAYVQARRCFHKGGGVKSSRQIKTDLHGIRSHQTFLKWMEEDYPDIWEHMIRDDDSPRHDGGDPPSGGLEGRMREQVLANLNQAKAAMRAIANPETRGEVIAEAEQLLNEMRSLRPWKPFEPEF